MPHCYSGSTSVPHQAELEDNNQITTAPPLIISPLPVNLTSLRNIHSSEAAPCSISIQFHHRFLIQPLYSPKNRTQDICVLLWIRRPGSTRVCKHAISCKELGFEGNRSVAFMRTDNDFHQHNTCFHVRIERNTALIIKLKTTTLAPTTTLSISYESIQRTQKTFQKFVLMAFLPSLLTFP